MGLPDGPLERGLERGLLLKPPRNLPTQGLQNYIVPNGSQKLTHENCIIIRGHPSVAETKVLILWLSCTTCCYLNHVGCPNRQLVRTRQVRIVRIAMVANRKREHAL